MDDAKDLISCASTSSAHNELLDSSLSDLSKDSGVDYIPNLSNDTKEDVAAMSERLKKAEISGMFPYPRVGRSGTEDQDLPGETEKAKWVRLVPMSRVHASVKRGREVGAPLWFGPRLGKRANQSPWPIINIREFPPKNQEASFTPRLGRESEEDPNEDYDNKPSLTDRL